uniref:Uncharacterized protein n=1 Tax=Salvator merianae TaxID=96440 RepID=A0A8D0DZJ0_SALMN
MVMAARKYLEVIAQLENMDNVLMAQSSMVNNEQKQHDEESSSCSPFPINRTIFIHKLPLEEIHVNTLSISSILLLTGLRIK